MLRPLRSPEVADPTGWLAPFVADFRARFMQLLAGGCWAGRARGGSAGRV